SKLRNAAASPREERNPTPPRGKARHRSKIPPFPKMNLISIVEAERSIEHPRPPHGPPQDSEPAFFVSSTTTRLFLEPGYRIDGAPSEAHPGDHRRGSLISASRRGAFE